MKLIKTAFIALALLLAIPSQAQLKVGLTAGLNISQLKLAEDDYKEYVDKIRPGFTIGPTAVFNIPMTGLGFDVSALFDMRGAKSKTYEDMPAIHCYSFQFPVNVRYGMEFGDIVHGFIFTGPQFGFSTGNKDLLLFSGTGKTSGHQLERRWVSENNSFSWNFGVGGVVMDKLQVRVSYNLALKSSGEVRQVDLVDGTYRTLTKGKAHACQITISYLL